MKQLVVAIDGPAGAGKSTVAQIVASRLSYTYIDTGAMYRAVTWRSMQNDGCIKDRQHICSIANTIHIELDYINSKLHVKADKVDITEEIRSPEVTNLVSEVAQIAEVRKAMVRLQKNMALTGGIVMDGRDIGTKVFPNADVKVFLTASIEERAYRRWLEMKEKGDAVDIEKIKAAIALRDKKDSERKISPLRQAEDAIRIDTTGLTIDEVAIAILKICEERKCLV